MSQLDFYHNVVREALEADGWTITDDPLTMALDDTKTFVDLAAERNIIGAERGLEKIAVEIKSYRGQSIVAETQKLMGQLDTYKYLLSQLEPDRELVAALPQKVYRKLLRMPTLYKLLSAKGVRWCVFSANENRIVTWTN